MADLLKNISKKEVLNLKEEVAYQDGQIVSKTLAQNDASGGDAFVTCLDGVGEVTIDGEKFQLTEGQSIVMPAGHPHAVYGKEQFKMLLVVVF